MLPDPGLEALVQRTGHRQGPVFVAALAGRGNGRTHCDPEARLRQALHPDGDQLAAEAQGESGGTDRGGRRKVVTRFRPGLAGRSESRPNGVGFREGPELR